MFRRIKTVLVTIMAILTIIGVVTFSMFILEESLQTVMFGTWAAQDAQNWSLVLKGADTNRKINRVLKIVTYTFGWINPFAFIAYKDYAKAMDYYIESLEAKVLQKAPHLMAGREVSLLFRTVKTATAPSGSPKPFILTSVERLNVYSDTRELTPFDISGLLTLENGMLFITSGKTKE